ncbi:MAG: HD domain-containing protein [Patescibacteria group bacterium]|nr:HD domain-containing protein [Patescibacteria group bacterium]
MAQYEIRDPVHARIPFNEIERGVIDHPFVQRLRYISQLSFLLSYVYPSGVHDRFSHALGAMHVAGRLFSRLIASSSIFSLRFSQDEIERIRQTVRLAGLLHDIGHGPFSHSSESVFPLWQKLPLNHDWWKVQYNEQAHHEDYSVLLIQIMAQEGILGEDMAQDIASLVHGGVRPSSFFLELEKRTPTLHAILKSIISGTIDCDRMDYLLRDSYFCGVTYGHFDLDWLISSMGIGEKDGHLILTLHENGVRAFEDMLLARYHMIDQVYFHKTKAGFTHYLEEAILSREIDLRIPSDPYEYVSIRDAAVLEKLFSAATDQNNYWSHHLMRRIAPKRILRLRTDNLSDTEILAKLKTLCQDNHIGYFTHTAAGELAKIDENIAPGSIHVVKRTLGDSIFVPIGEYSDLLQKYNEKINFTDFFVLREDFERFEEIVDSRR